MPTFEQVVRGDNIPHEDVQPYNGVLDLGDPEFECMSCGAIMWYDERANKQRNNTAPSYTLCCGAGKVKIPLLKDPPSTLKNLLYGFDHRSKMFLENIRAYNMMFSFTSMGGKVDSSVNNGSGPYVFRLNGQNCHKIGSLLPETGANPKFAQLYIHDTENEIANRVGCFSARNNQTQFDHSIIEDIKIMLDENNALAQSFRLARDRMISSEINDFKLRLVGSRKSDGRMYNIPTASEVVALIVGDIDIADDFRDIIVETRSGILKRINELHPSYLPMQYPLLFPYGEDGYRKDILFSGDKRGKRETVSMREFFCFRIQQRNVERSTILRSRKLFQQFMVDSYTMIEAERLSFIRHNQKHLRADLYRGLSDAVLRGETDPSSAGKRIILPSTYVGGARYMIQNYQDAMAICRWTGYPDIFITFTCNSKWPEIQRFIDNEGLRPEDRPGIITRVFKMKLDNLIRHLKVHKIFGRVRALMYTIEFQKRGLPHAHILLFLHPEDKHSTAHEIDSIISAEIPDQYEAPDLYESVKNFMIHGPCGVANKNSPCMTDGICSKHFPKQFNSETTIDRQGYSKYMRRNNGRTVEKNKILLDNRFVVPYNRELLIKYDAHINVEWCNQHRAIKYLFKYINKGNDRITAAFYQPDENGVSGKEVDEVKMYYDCRYISPCDAAWRIFAFPITHREPSVERLSFHLPGEQNIIFRDDDPIDEVVRRGGEISTMFLQWMKTNEQNAEARELTYAEFPTKFVWKETQEIDESSWSTKRIKKWCPRQRGMSIGRIFYVHPGAGELYYLRILLNIVRGPSNYDGIKTVDGKLYPTFKDACFALGLLDDDKEYVYAIAEASLWGSGQFLRTLFATLLFSNCMTSPEIVWNQTWHLLSDDILHQQRRILNNQDLQMSDDELKNYVLAEIEKILNRNGRSLKEFSTLPFPDRRLINEGRNMLIQDELSYDRVFLTEESDKLIASLNVDQRRVFQTIINATSKDEGGMFFVYGFGGTGKTFICKALSSILRSQGEIVLTVASSGIASLLMPGGRTAHSRFGIPLVVNEESTCNIKQGSQLAELIIRTQLIIWDEAPMVHKHSFEALDRTLRDIMRFKNSNSLNLPFGGKVVVFGGDFRQILPVIPKGSRQDIVTSTLNASYLWSYCKVLKLTKNMRLQTGNTNSESYELRSFSDWILSIGDGTIGGDNDGDATFDIPDDLLIKDSDDPIGAIVDSTYPFLLEKRHDQTYLQERAILAPTLDCVGKVNEYMLTSWPGEEVCYLSSDSICKADHYSDSHENIYTPEFLNSLNSSGLPNHRLVLKVGVPVMLLRNIDQNNGLCNGTRLVVTQLGKHVIEAEQITGANIGQKVFIPRLSLTPSDIRLPFKFQRRQYPLVVCFAMTIIKVKDNRFHMLAYIFRVRFSAMVNFMWRFQELKVDRG